MGSNTNIGIEVTKFSLVGFINFLLTFAVFAGLLKFWGADYLFSLAAAWAVGVIFSYAANLLWVFRAESALRFNSRFPKFFMSGLASVSANAALLDILVKSMRLDPFIAQLLLMPLIVAVNFFAARYWSMRRSRPEESREGKSDK